MDALTALRSSAIVTLFCVATLAIGCGGAHTPLPAPVALREGERPVGTPGRSRVLAASLIRDWVVLLQARADTNHDGALCSYTDGYHGFEIGDEPTPWLVLGDGPGEALDELYGATDDQRFLAFAQGDQVVLLHVETSQRTTLGPRTARSRWPHLEAGESATVGATQVVYRRSDRDATVIDPATRIEATYTIPSGWLFRAFVSNGWLVAEVLDERPTHPTSSSELPHYQTSAGDEQCSLATERCFGPAGRIVLFRLGDPRPIEAGRHGVAVQPWGFVRASDDAQLFVVRHPSGRATALGGRGCNGQLLMMGEQPHLVAYRCESDGKPHVLVFPDDETASPTDETPRIAGGVAAWIALGVPARDAERLATLEATRDSLYFISSAAEAYPLPRPLDQATAFHRLVPRCGDPLSAGARSRTQLCAHVGPDVEIVAANEEGKALARVQRPTETPACDGDDTQLVWMHVEVEELR